MSSRERAFREFQRTRQVRGEPRRRWFHTPIADLIVWLREDDSIDGFQFCYDKDSREYALTWREGFGYSHMAVDAGERRGTSFKGAPILVANGAFDAQRILALFNAQAGTLPPGYASFIAAKIGEVGS